MHAAPLPRRPGPTTRVRVTELHEDAAHAREDRLAVEEPLEIRVVAPGLPPATVATTMRTPGHDFELVAGWLVHEGVTEPAHLREIRYCTDTDLRPEQVFNVVTAELAVPPLRLPANRTISSACGICGADSVADALARAVRPVPRTARIDRDTVFGLPGTLGSAQPAFTRTGGLHAAGLFDTDGRCAAVREDVGRHNAVDKVVGSRLLGQATIPPVLVLSGRIGFELVQKAVAAGVEVIVAIGAPTSLAVRLGAEAGLTVVGFTRGDRCVVYAGADRLGV